MAPLRSVDLDGSLYWPASLTWNGSKWRSMKPAIMEPAIDWRLNADVGAAVNSKPSSSRLVTNHAVKPVHFVHPDSHLPELDVRRAQW